MGALCGKESSNDPFSQPGRTLSSAPAPKQTSSVPKKASVGGPPRALGNSSTSPTSEQDDAKRQAALAAERRAALAKRPTGKLGSQLNKEKQLTQAELLKKQAEESTGHRAVDQNKDALRHD